MASEKSGAEELQKPRATDELEEILRQHIPAAFSEGELMPDKLLEHLGKGESGSDSDRYEFNWAGKHDALEDLRNPTSRTLVPEPERSVEYEDTENLFIEGDNLEVLKILQNAYRESVKLMYLDPPYNTGGDFIYKDAFQESKQDYEERTNQRSDSGGKLVANPETRGRFHSDWLSMMYPRLFRARDLLRDDGVLVMSIDSNEKHHLRMILDELFGSENLLAELVWERGAGSTSGHFMQSHEYLLVYAKNKDELSYFDFKQGLDDFHNFDSDVISERAVKKIGRKNPASEITFPAGTEIDGVSDAVFTDKIEGTEEITIVDDEMRFEDGELVEDTTLKAGWAMKSQIEEWIENGVAYDTRGQKVRRFFFSNTGKPQYEKERGTIHPRTIISEWTTQDGTRAVESLFDEDVDFSYPKPVGMLKQLIHLITDDGDLVMDFFAGSGTTAHAAMLASVDSDKSIPYVTVQLDEEAEDAPDEFETLADVCLERIRRAATQIQDSHHVSGADLGVKCFSVSESNFPKWNPPETTEELEEQTSLYTKWDFEGEEKAALIEILLTEGFTPNASISSDTTASQIDYYLVEEEGRELFVTFSGSVVVDDIDSLGLDPDVPVVCLDSRITDTQKDNIARHYTLKTV